MIGAMYENGGNTTHRLLDGHPQLFVYPFESQLGTRLVTDALGLDVPGQVPLAGVRARRDARAGLPRDHRRGVQGARADAAREQVPRPRRSTSPTTSGATLYVGHVARERPLARGQRRGVLPRDLRGVAGPPRERAARRSTSATARSSSSTPRRSCATAGRALPPRRAQPLVGLRRHEEAARAALARATTCSAGTLNQHCALLARERFPDRFHVVRAEDVMADPARSLEPVCERLGLEPVGLARDAELERRAARPRSTRGGRSGRRRRRRTAPPPRSSPRTSATRCASAPGCSWRRSATTTSSALSARPVTGAAGFVGANLVRRLLADGHRVVALVRPGGDPWRLEGLDVDVVEADVRDGRVAGRLRASVFHLAAHGAYSWQDDETAIRETNVLGTENALRAGRAGRRRGLVVRVRAARTTRPARTRRPSRTAPTRPRRRRRRAARRWSGARSCCGSTRPTGRGRSRAGSCRRCSRKALAGELPPLVVAAGRAGLRPRRRRLRGVRHRGARRAAPAASTTSAPAARRRSPRSSRPCGAGRSRGRAAVGLDARPQLGHRDLGREPGADPRRARLGGADRAGGRPRPHARLAQARGARGSATDCPRSDRAEPQLLVRLDAEASGREEREQVGMRAHVLAAVVVDEPAADAVVLLGDRLERDDVPRGELARGREHRGRRGIREVVQEVHHQDEVEALALRHELGGVHAPERVSLVAAAPARVVDIRAVQVDAQVAAARERGVLADPATDVEDARLAVEQPPAGEQCPAPPVEPEREVEPDAARLPHQRPVEDAHRRQEDPSAVRADDRLAGAGRARLRLHRGAVVREAEAVDHHACVPGGARLGDRVDVVADVLVATLHRAVAPAQVVRVQVGANVVVVDHALDRGRGGERRRRAARARTRPRAARRPRARPSPRRCRHSAATSS